MIWNYSDTDVYICLDNIVSGISQIVNLQLLVFVFLGNNGAGEPKVMETPPLIILIYFLTEIFFLGTLGI